MEKKSRTLLTCLFFLLVGALLCNAQSVSMSGAGSYKFTGITNLYSSSVVQNVELPYTLTSLSQAKTQFSLSRIDYLITQSPLSPAEHSLSECSGAYDLREFPLNVDGLVLIYTIPGVDTQSSATPTLILDRQLIVDIYLGVVNKWNDARIVALNPSLASVLPDATFTPYYISDSSLSEVFSSTLASFNSTWSTSTWPAGASVSNEDGNGADRMQAQVLAVSSIGFVQYSVSTSLKNIARVVNRAGVTVSATKSSFTSAATEYIETILSFINRTNADPYVYPASALNIMDGGGSNSWPFAHFNFLVTRTNSFQDCLKASAMNAFLNWLLLETPVWESNAGLALVPGSILSSLSSNVVAKMSCCQKISGGTTTKSPLYGKGTDYTSNALSQLATLFNALNYAATVSYSLSSSATDALDQVLAGSIDFAITSSPPSSPASSFHTIPLIGSAVVCIYNVQGVSNLALTTAQMSSIFTGEISNWQTINSAYPNQPINIVNLANSDVSSIFLAALGNPAVTFTSSTQQETINSVNATAYSIGIVQLTTVTAEYTIASYVNSVGQTITPTNLTSLQSYFNGDTSSGWPLSSYSYITFKADSGSFCPPLVNLATFIYWSYTDASANNAMLSSLSVRPPNADSVGRTLNSITCSGSPLLVPTLVIPGAGSTFAAGVYQAWLTAYSYVDGEVSFTYTGTGSGAGIASIIARNVIYAGTDAQLSTQQATDGGDLQLYPVFAGSVVLAYRIDSLGENSPSLNFTREVIVDIYRGVITRWNDQRILDINPQVSSLLPDAAIVLVYRSDSSGTTNIFTKALNSFNPSAWTLTGTRIDWPVAGITGEGSSGLGLRIFSTANSLGYVELSYAISNSLSYSNIRNKAGQWVSASIATTQSAMNDYINSFAPDFTCSIVDGSGRNSWPLAAYTYLALHTRTMNDYTTALKMLEFIQWGVTSNVASARVGDLGFAPLPSALVNDQLIPKLHEVTVNGVSVLGELKDNDSDRLALGLGVGLGIGVPLLLIIVFLLVYTRHVKRRRRKLQDGFSIEAPEWADEGVELQPYNDTMGLKINNGNDVFKFGIPKGSRFPVMQTLTERITISNESNEDRNFAFFVPRDDMRFKMVIMPGYGALRPGEETSVEVRFTLLMTTAVERKVKFEVLGCGEQAIPLKVAGDVSTRLDPNEIDILGKPIGQGAFGTVYRGTYRGTQVAVKVLARQNELLKAQTDEFLKEIDLMHKLRSPFIVGFIGASYVPGKLCVLTEFMEKGSVASMLRKIKLEHHQRLKIAYDCAMAMAFLHNNGVMHRDLKPANLLVVSLSSSAEVTVKLADFGTSRTVTHINVNSHYTNGWGTPGYMAPELLARGEYSGKVDVYAFGILLLELYIQKDPYGFMKRMWDLPDFIIGGNRPEIPADCPSEYASLITQCWAQSGSDRPSFPDLIVTLEPMYASEKIRAKETKRRMVEAGLTPVKSSGSYDGNPTNTNSNNLSNTNNLSNNLSNNLTRDSLNNNTNDPLYNSLSQDANGSGSGVTGSGHMTFKGKERTLLTNSNDVTSLANLSNDNISKDRKMYFTENKDDL